jgi:hypothetical protein
MSDNLKCICEALVVAEHYNLSAEMVLSALQHQRAYPDASIKECIQVALDEWDLDIY